MAEGSQSWRPMAVALPSRTDHKAATVMNGGSVAVAMAMAMACVGVGGDGVRRSVFLGRRGAGLAAMVRSRSLALHSAQRAFERTHGNSSYFLSSLVAPPPAGDASSNVNCNNDEMELIEGTAVRVRGGRCCMTRFDSIPTIYSTPSLMLEVGRVFFV